MFAQSPIAKQNEALKAIRAEYKSLKDKSDTSESKSFIKEYIGSEAWRFFIEGDRQNEGPTALKKLISDLQGQIPRLYQLGSLGDHTLNTLRALREQRKGPLYSTLSPTIDELIQILESMMATTGIHDDNMTMNAWSDRVIGWLPFEATEPGYLKPLITTLWELETTDQKLDANFITSLQCKATRGVKRLVYEQKRIESELGHFREESNAYFNMNSSNTSKQGLLLLLNKLRNKEQSRLLPKLTLSLVTMREQKKVQMKLDDLPHEDELVALVLPKSSGQQGLWKLESKIEITKSSDSLLERAASLFSQKPEKQKVGDIIEQYVTHILKRYEEAVVQAKTDRDKLKCIAIMIQDLEQLHPFTDANCRTLCMLLPIYVLRTQGFPPPMLQNPNYFDGYSVDELVDQLIVGMKNTMDIATKRKEALFGVTTDAVLKQATPAELEYAASLGIQSSDEELQKKVRFRS